MNSSISCFGRGVFSQEKISLTHPLTTTLCQETVKTGPLPTETSMKQWATGNSVGLSTMEM